MRVLMDLLIVVVKRDAKLVQEHPEYFQRDEAGRILPHFKWGNAAADHGHPGFRRYIADFAAYCVREYGVDGFRVDAASATTPNWYPHSGRAPWQTVMGSYSLLEEVNRAIKAANPEAILLDELGGPVFFHVADICHNFGFVHQLTWPENKAAGYTAWHYQRLLADMQDALPAAALRVFYTRNHDSAWFTRSFEYSPEFFSYEAFHCLVRGIPLMFAGQARWPGPDEAAMAFYRKLFALRRAQPALVGGECLYRAVEVDREQVFAVVRRLGETILLCLVSTAGEPLSLRVRLVEPGLAPHPGPRRLADLFAGRDVEVESAADFSLTLEPYGVRVLRL
jgi:glycosidase